jgi:membrane protease YdiL (CAAX protease family)
MIHRMGEINLILKKTKIISTLFLTPILGGMTLALPAYLLKATDLYISSFIYLGELLTSLYIICRSYGLFYCGLGKTLSISKFFWIFYFLVIRLIPWLILLPIKFKVPELKFITLEIIYYVFINATAEEIYFRGLLYSGISKELSRVVISAIISSVLFGIVHLSLGEPTWIPIFIADGLAFCAIRIRTNSIVPSILSHGLLNLILTDFFIVSPTLSDTTALIYSIATIAIDLMFFSLVLYKYQPRKCLS